jgi:type VI secretion system protein ImpH
MKERGRSLEEILFSEEACEFDFFHAVWLLHLIFSDRPGVGRIGRPGDEPVRFTARQSLQFQASSIHSLSDETDPPRMTVAFMGLTGVQGVLPLHYTEHILSRAASPGKNAKDFTMAEFFDLFNHRLLGLFYRAWEKHRFPARYQLAAAQNKTDDITQYLFDLIGMGTGGLRERMAVPDLALLRYAGLLQQRPASAVALQAILHDYFALRVEVEEFIGAWHRLEPEYQADLASPEINNCLGEGAIAGDAVWDTQARFRVRLGPLEFNDFTRFLPGTPALQELHDLTRFYVGPVLDFDVQLVVQREEVPGLCFGDDSATGPRLGWYAWLKTGGFEADAGDAVFSTSECLA